jgi:hypothetical protein
MELFLRELRAATALCRLASEFWEGLSRGSMTRNSTGPLAHSSLRPGVWMAVKTDGLAPLQEGTGSAKRFSGGGAGIAGNKQQVLA